MDSPRPKRVLGITGNIASGKSYVRQYLENSGAVTVDADLLAQETYLPGNPAYQPVLEAFGSDLKMPDGQISRGKLGRIVFRDADALAQLEKIIHPIVRERARQIIEDSDATLVVLEAIKLFESAMDQDCNQIWVVDADEKTRLERLMTTRGLEEKEAWRRIHSQPPQAEKIARAHRVIHTDQSYHSTYDQVRDGLAEIGAELPTRLQGHSGLYYQPLQPEYFAQAAALIPAGDDPPFQPEDFYRLLGSASLIANFDGERLNQLISWRIEHFLAIVQARWPVIATTEVGEEAFLAIEDFANMHDCSLLIIPSTFLRRSAAKTLGYLPGEDPTPNVHPLAVVNFLRKNGFMPGEVYQKELRSAHLAWKSNSSGILKP